MRSNTVDQLPTFEPLLVLDVLHYDNRIKALHDVLTPFRHHVFDPTQRIVLLHNDTEYFLPGQQLGFTMHNVMNCWRSLDLPWHAMMVVTNHADYTAAVWQSRDLPQQDRPDIQHCLVNDCSWQAAQHWIRPGANRQPRFAALSLMATRRSHRIALWQFVQQQDLQGHIAINFDLTDSLTDQARYGHSINDHDRLRHQDMMSPPVLTDLPFGTIHSWPHRINEDFFSNCRHPVLTALSQQPSLPHRDARIQGELFDFYQDFFCDIVTETVFDYPYAYISEKTLRPLLLAQPFMLLGPPGTLALLSSLGFETFGDCWDESYDQIPDPALRFCAFCRSMQDVVMRPVTELQRLHHDLADRREHNRQLLLCYIEQRFRPLYRKLGFNL